MPSLAQYQSYMQLPQVRAALDTIAWAEGGTYNKLFGGGTFSGNQHPNTKVSAGGYVSTAAGRYQFLNSTWQEVRAAFGFADFSPANQDIGALYLINQRGDLGKLLNGDFEGMMKGLGCLWAALPYSTCGQKMRPLADTMNYYNNALRVYSGGGGPLASLPLSTAGSISPIPAGALMLGFAVVLLLLTRD